MSQETNRHHEPSENTREETLALLRYMADHNSHHAKELEELGHGVTGEAEALISQSIKALEESTKLLQNALKLLEE